MAQKITYYCDGCGREKGEVNHWWSARVDGEGFTLRPFLAGNNGNNGNNGKIYCGQECVIKAANEYMDRCREGVET